MITIIAAVSDNNVIGHQGRMPWRLRTDLHHFRDLTLGGTVAMGRATYESIGAPLPLRENIVFSRAGHIEGVTLVRDMKPFLWERMRMKKPLFIIGGSKIYEEALPMTNVMHLTRIHAEVEGDRFFPSFEMSDWKVVSERRHEPSSWDQYPFTIQCLRRVPKVDAL